MKRIVLFVSLFILTAVTAVVFYVRHQLQQPGSGAPGLVEIPRGLKAREVLRLLEGKGVIADENAAFAYLIYTGTRTRLQAGEYLFDRPMTTPEVVRKLVSGDVYLHKFTVPEGFTLTETADEWEKQGFGKSREFLEAATGALDLIREYDAKALSLEGYLFPETYSFPSKTTAQQAVDSMVSRFRLMIRRLDQTAPRASWPLNPRDTVILASLVEAEAAHADERPLVASVYLNRISRKMLLQCDPTVIYALEQANQYRGRLLLADLKFKSPYNTYVNVGLPPGPISNPGYAALLAAVQPAHTKYLYFVRTLEGRHTFSETLAAHNRAVAEYRRLQRRQKL